MGQHPPNRLVLLGYRLVSSICFKQYPTLDDNEVIGSVGMNNALLRNYERAPEPQEPVGEGGYLVDWAGKVKKRVTPFCLRNSFTCRSTLTLELSVSDSRTTD
jgi:hypothetical protein